MSALRSRITCSGSPRATTTASADPGGAAARPLPFCGWLVLGFDAGERVDAAHERALDLGAVVDLEGRDLRRESGWDGARQSADGDRGRRHGGHGAFRLAPLGD